MESGKCTIVSTSDSFPDTEMTKIAQQGGFWYNGFMSKEVPKDFILADFIIKADDIIVS